MISHTEAAAEEGVILNRGSFQCRNKPNETFQDQTDWRTPKSRHLEQTHTHTHSAVNTYLEQLAL